MEEDLEWKALEAPDDGLHVHELNVDPDHADHDFSELPYGALPPPSRRLKRKNVSKALQLHTLEQYAQYTREHNAVPDASVCRQLLQQSHTQFLKDGGAADEPALTYADFLKLIRNRRRERKHMPQVSTSSAARSLTPAKRRRQQEQLRIWELIDDIDRARGRQEGPTDVVDAILQLQRETRAVQLQIEARLEVIRSHPSAQQLEPSSASV